MDAAAKIRPTWIVAFTGHRPSDAPGRSRSELNAARGAIREALVELQRRAERLGGDIELLTGAAAGADHEAIEAALASEIAVHIVLPKPIEQFEQDFEGNDERDWPRINELLKRARAGDDGWTLRVINGEHRSPDCYHEANLYMLRRADAVVAVVTDDSGQKRGGAAELVAQAKTLGTATIVIDPGADGAMKRRGAADDWPPRDEVIDQLQEDLSANEQASSSAAGDRRGEGLAWTIFEQFDRRANAEGGHFRGRLTQSIKLHFAAALLAAMTASFSIAIYSEADAQGETFLGAMLDNLPWLLTLFEFALVALATWLMFEVSRRRSQDRWRRCRFAAELTHGLIMSARLLDPLDPLIAHHDARWRRFAIFCGLAAHRTAPAPDLRDATDLARKRDAYREGRLENQISHFSRRMRPAQSGRFWLTRIAAGANIAALVVILSAVFVKLRAHHHVAERWELSLLASFLPVALPLIAGAANSLLAAHDAGRRSDRYARMVERLRRLSEFMPLIKTEGALRSAVEETEEILLDELVEWRTASKNLSH